MLDNLQIAACGGIALLAVVVIFSYTRVAMLARRCERAAADIDVQLRYRHDLLPNLIEAVRGFASHERSVVEQLMSARSAAARASNPAERDVAEAEMSSRIGLVFATVEHYPEVRGSQHFTELRREMTDVENKIVAARRFLNMAVTEYNATVSQFPANIIAKMTGLRQKSMFDLGSRRPDFEDAPVAKF